MYIILSHILKQHNQINKTMQSKLILDLKTMVMNLKKCK